MKNSGKMFILLEAMLAVLVIVVAMAVMRENYQGKVHRVSVVLPDSDDAKWASFKYGLKMAAQDYGVNLVVTSTGNILTTAEEKSIIEQEIDSGADAVIVQPVFGENSQEILRETDYKVPVLLAGDGGVFEFPTVEPDHYALGKALARELMEDYSGNLLGKSLGIMAKDDGSTALLSRREGFLDGIEEGGATVLWSLWWTDGQEPEQGPEDEARVDVIIALDDDSLVIAGEASAANNLRGALVYGIGRSMEAVYYLDSGNARCMVVPDEFYMGYQSMTEIAKALERPFYHMQDMTVSYTVLRKETLFAKENQEIIFTMSQ